MVGKCKDCKWWRRIPLPTGKLRLFLRFCFGRSVIGGFCYRTPPGRIMRKRETNEDEHCGEFERRTA